MAWGVRSDAVCHVPRPRASAYLALPERLPDFAGREVAVLWDAHHGWGLGVETSSGEDLIMLAYLGEDVLARAGRGGGRFVPDAAARPAGRASSSHRSCGAATCGPGWPGTFRPT